MILCVYVYMCAATGCLVKCVLPIAIVFDSEVVLKWKVHRNFQSKLRFLPNVPRKLAACLQKWIGLNVIFAFYVAPCVQLVDTLCLVQF